MTRLTGSSARRPKVSARNDEGGSGSGVPTAHALIGQPGASADVLVLGRTCAGDSQELAMPAVFLASACALRSDGPQPGDRYQQLLDTVAELSHMLLAERAHGAAVGDANSAEPPWS
jgi:hypothetical protein